MADEARNDDTHSQAAQHELVEQAKREPGIAEALAAYETIRPYVPQRPVAARSQVRFSTGGNS